MAKFADGLLAHTQQATQILPKNKRTTIRDAQIQTTTNPMQDRNFRMFHGQRSTLGNGLSGEPRGSQWKMIKPRSQGWLCFFRKQMLSNFVSSKRPFPGCKRLSLPKRLTQRCPPRLQRVICLAPHSHLPTTGSETFPGTTSRQLNLYSMMMMRKMSLDLKPDAINGP